MLAAGAGAGPPPRPAELSVEIEFSTHVGESSHGAKFMTRDGCYQAESVGSAGGATRIHVSSTGCHRPAQVAALFGRLDRIGPAGLVRQESARDGGAGAAPTRDPGGSTTLVTLIGPDG